MATTSSIFKGPWLPDTPLLVVGVPPPTASYWPDVSGKAPKTIRGKILGTLYGTMGKGREWRNGEEDENKRERVSKIIPG